jgi:hypothetical protein
MRLHAAFAASNVKSFVIALDRAVQAAEKHIDSVKSLAVAGWDEEVLSVIAVSEYGDVLGIKVKGSFVTVTDQQNLWDEDND